MQQIDDLASVYGQAGLARPLLAYFHDYSDLSGKCLPESAMEMLGYQRPLRVAVSEGSVL